METGRPIPIAAPYVQYHSRGEQIHSTIMEFGLYALLALAGVAVLGVLLSFFGKTPAPAV
jgi:hypothetical protein